MRAEKVKEERRQREVERKEAKRREERRMLAVAEGCQLYVGGLAIRCDDAALGAHFARFGTVSDALVIRDSETGLSRGFGFVTLTDTERAREAVKQCNGREAKGLCPQHGRMQVRLASKSKAQQEFEARRAAAAAKAGAAAAAAPGVAGAAGAAGAVRANRGANGANGADGAAGACNGGGGSDGSASSEEEEEEATPASVGEGPNGVHSGAREGGAAEGCAATELD